MPAIVHKKIRLAGMARSYIILFLANYRGLNYEIVALRKAWAGTAGSIGCE